MADAVFLALSVLTVGSAIAALELRSLIYGSVALMGTLAGIAGFFLLLDSPFVALFQIAVYVGSIAVLILFTVMLVRRELIFIKIEDARRRYAGIGLMLIFMVAIGGIIVDSGVRQITTDAPPVDFTSIGEDFLIHYWPALIAMALILATSVTAALILAIKGREISNPAIPASVPIKATEPYMSERSSSAAIAEPTVRTESAKNTASAMCCTSLIYYDL